MADRAVRHIDSGGGLWLLPRAAETLLRAGLVPLGVAALSTLSFFGYLYVAGLLLVLSLFLPFSPTFRALGYSPVGFALFVIWEQVSLAGFAAPFLALAYALLDYLYLQEPLLPLFGVYGVTLMAWVRLVAAVAGIGMSLAYVFLDARWRLEQLRQIRNLPRSKTRSAAIGLAEFEGVARALRSDPKAAGERIESRRILPAEPAEPMARFCLEDETGRILVDPAGARLRTGMAFHLWGQLCEIYLGNATKRGTRQGELWDGDPLYLIGSVQIDADAPPDRSGSGGVVVRPLAVPHYSGPLWRLLFGKEPPGQQREAPNVFFASDSREHGARQAIVSGLRQSVLFALIWVLASGWLLNRELQRFGGREYWRAEAVTPEPVDPREERARLVGALRSANEFERTTALNALWGRRDEFKNESTCCPELASALVATLDGKDRHARDFAEFALATMQYDRPRIVPEIVRVLGSPDPGVRESAADTLGRIKSAPEVALPALIGALDDPVQPVTTAACHALAEYPEAMAFAFQCLKERLAAPDHEVRREAVSHLSRIRLEPVLALPLWSELLNGSDKTFTYFAAIGLNHLGSEARPALPQLIEALRNRQHNGRVFVVRTLGMLGAEAAPAVPDLIAVLEEHRTEVQHNAVIALRAIGPAAAEALPALRRLQQEAYDASLRNNAALAVRDIERR